MFSRNDKKLIPINLEDYLTSLSLTIWYIDSIYALPKLNLSGFNLNIEDINYISYILKNKHNIETIIKLESKEKVTFYIKNLSNYVFSNLVKSYILPSLQYKLKSQDNKLTL